VISPEPKKAETRTEPAKPAPAVIRADIPAVELSPQKAAEETIAIQFPTASLSTEANKKPETPAVISPEPKKN
jgi:hypothetical protein